MYKVEIVLQVLHRFTPLKNRVGLNPLSPSIHIQILQTDLHTFLLRIVERIWFKIKAFSLC